MVITVVYLMSTWFLDSELSTCYMIILGTQINYIAKRVATYKIQLIICNHLTKLFLLFRLSVSPYFLQYFD